MSVVATLLISFAGGGLGGAAIKVLHSVWVDHGNRRGRARLIHEDMLRLQSTIARLLYETLEERQWGEASWLVPCLADAKAQQDVLAHLSRWPFSEKWPFSACASALGWGEYLRSAYGGGLGLRDSELETIYHRLASGRVALERLAKLTYRPHKVKPLFDSAMRYPDVELSIDRETALSEAKRRSECDLPDPVEPARMHEGSLASPSEPTLGTYS